jgi:diguanylate cyclase
MARTAATTRSIGAARDHAGRGTFRRAASLVGRARFEPRKRPHFRAHFRCIGRGATARLDSTLTAPIPPTPAAALAAASAAGRLNVDAALSLLRQSGYEAPAGEAGSAAWLQGLIDTLCELSSRDALTGLANRRHFEMVLAREIDRVARAGEPALLLLLDIDHFKSVNDEHGHAAGDLVLKAVSDTLLECVRPMDTVARIGGEEFAVVLPNCPPVFGPMVADRIRAKIERRPVPVGMTQQVSVTVSLGGAFAPQWVRSSVRLWLERADLQLYNAKTGGRNRANFEAAAVAMVTAEEKGLLFGTSQFVPDAANHQDNSREPRA